MSDFENTLKLIQKPPTSKILSSPRADATARPLKQKIHESEARRKLLKSGCTTLVPSYSQLQQSMQFQLQEEMKNLPAIGELCIPTDNQVFSELMTSPRIAGKRRHSILDTGSILSYTPTMRLPAIDRAYLEHSKALLRRKSTIELVDVSPMLAVATSIVQQRKQSNVKIPLLKLAELNKPQKLKHQCTYASKAINVQQPRKYTPRTPGRKNGDVLRYVQSARPKKENVTRELQKRDEQRPYRYLQLMNVTSGALEDQVWDRAVRRMRRVVADRLHNKNDVERRYNVTFHGNN